MGQENDVKKRKCDLSNWSVDTAGLPGRYQNIVLSAAGGSLTVKIVPGGTSIRMKQLPADVGGWLRGGKGYRLCLV